MKLLCQIGWHNYEENVVLETFMVKTTRRVCRDCGKKNFVHHMGVGITTYSDKFRDY